MLRFDWAGVKGAGGGGVEGATGPVTDEIFHWGSDLHSWYVAHLELYKKNKASS
jgi:hypothetical protein